MSNNDNAYEWLPFLSASTFPLQSALVTGGAGFIGTHLISELATLGYKNLVSLDIADPQRPINGVKYVKGDVRQPLNVDGEFDVVFNLAAVHRTPGHPAEEYYETNVAGAVNVTDFCSSRRINTIVFTSSISTYGPNEDEKSEDSPLTPTSNYGKSKMLAEDIHRQWLAHTPDGHLVVVRPAVTFGLGEGGNFDRLLGALRSRRFMYPGRRDTIKACGNVTDLVGSIIWALDLNERSITYNFCYPERTSIEQIVTAISASADVPLPTRNIPLPLMLAAAQPFDLLDRVGVHTGVNKARIYKLVESTNIYPKVLVDRKYPYRTNLETGVQLWIESLKDSI